LIVSSIHSLIVVDPMISVVTLTLFWWICFFRCLWQLFCLEHRIDTLITVSGICFSAFQEENLDRSWRWQSWS
jgi:hypothetical protein